MLIRSKIILLGWVMSLILSMDLSAQPNYSIAGNKVEFDRAGDSSSTRLKFINTPFENASQLDWEVDSNSNINISLIYDHERASPNRATNHWHFQVQADPGSDLVLILKNFDNIWNGKKAFPVSARTSCLVSEDGINWTAIPAELISDNRLRFRGHMNRDKLYAASVEPYRLSDLEKLETEIRNNPLIEIKTIGRTVE